jgi:DNA ligase-1
MKPWQVIQELESDNSRLTKESILKKHLVDPVLQAGLSMALSAFVTFGVKQVPESNQGGPGLSWPDFADLATRLQNRELTGNAARDAVDAAMLKATVTQWNDWYRRILIKDLKCGVSEKTVNKVAKELKLDYSVPVFTCQLAHDSANHEAKLSGTKLVEVKLDGVRVLTIVYPTGKVEQFSRNGKELVNFPHIREQFARTVTGITEPVVFDGEVMSSSFQDLMKQVHRKDNVQANDAVLYLFDLIPLANFEDGYYSRKQSERSAKVQAWKDLWAEETANIQVLEHELVNLDTEQGEQRFREINAKAISGGYEGIMIKSPDAPYECKRSTSWLKLKPFIEVSLTVVGIEEGTGKNVGKLGAFVCEGVDDGKTIQVNVGSGFSDAQRDEYFDTAVVGSIAEVRADAITQNQDGSYSLRFPRFKTFRGFQHGDKI